MNWHPLDINTVYSKTGSSPQGLSTEAAEKKKAEFGLNELVEAKKKPAWLLFLSQFGDFMILVLMVAAVIAGIIGDFTDAIIILVIVILNAIIGFIQEYRAEKAMEALKKLAEPKSNLLRNGETVTLSSAELVPGDIVLLEAGNIVPADMRLIEAHALRNEESSLTGESVPVDKSTEIIKEKDIPLGNRFNMAYKGTLVINGRARGIVVATGMKTEIGEIAQMLQEPERRTPLQKRMIDFGKKLSWLIIIICAILFGIGLLRGEETVKMILVAVSLAVAAIPEALPALITIALARGAKRLVKKNALIRKLPAVETLGSVTFICSDKTGTLTENKMKVVQVDPFESAGSPFEGLSMLELAMALNHDVKKNEEGEWIGDPTEIAMVNYIMQKHEKVFEQLTDRFPRKSEIPFDSDRKRMTTIHSFDDKFLVLVKGAAEAIATILKNKKLEEEILKKSATMAADGIRVLAYGSRIIDKNPETPDHQQIEQELDFAGLAGLIDPPREEAKPAIQECKTAGIEPVMITGDHQETATAIARQLGILGENDIAISGTELEKMKEEELEEKVERIKVYARVSPAQKLKIVKALQKRNYFVAMTGDGVNDAPSLKRADIGIAMGITGTDVSKEASAMILLDDNFATIVKAIREGRRIYDNIRKFIKYIMTCNSAEILTIFIAPLVGLPIPLLPIHILWINLVTDGLPGLALSAEKAEKNIMERPPRKTNESLFSGGITFHIIWIGILMAIITLGTQALAIYLDKSRWQTMVFTVLSLSQLGHVMAIRSEYEFIFKKGLFSNRPLILAVVLTIILQLLVIYLPYANTIFKTQPLSLTELLICFGLSILVFHAVEFEKLVKKRRKQ